MASFMSNLWNSIFTPGPTSTLLYATNIAFGALLSLLVALLAATNSIHFLILSILACGLWWAINWFAKEVRHAQEQEEAKVDSKRAAIVSAPTTIWNASEDAMDTGDDTETEIDDDRQREGTPSVAVPEVSTSDSAISGRAISTATGVAPLSTNTDARSAATRNGQMSQRQRQSMAESTGSLSTDSEWEKVDEDQ